MLLYLQERETERHYIVALEYVINCALWCAKGSKAPRLTRGVLCGMGWGAGCEELEVPLRFP